MSNLSSGGLTRVLNYIKTWVTNLLSSKANSSHTHDDRYYTETEINTLLLSKVYPVGAIYISVNSVNPGTLFGGTWEQIKDQFLLSSGDTYSIGSTGGNSSTTLEIANLPSHSHTGTTGNQSADHIHGYSGTTSADGSHVHNAWTDSQGNHYHDYYGPGCDAADAITATSEFDAGRWSARTTGWAGSHSHGVGMDWDGYHSHTFSGTTGGISANHNHSFTTSSVGSTQAFSNMPPYLTVNIWKRTA